MIHKVREAIRLVERNGWIHMRTRGSHRIYNHPEKPGNVVIRGRPGEDVPQSLWHSILKQAGLKE